MKCYRTSSIWISQAGARVPVINGANIMRLATVAALMCISFTVAEALPRAYVAASGRDGNGCTMMRPCRTVQRALAEIGSRGTVTIIQNGEYPSFAVGSSEPNVPGGVIPPTNIPEFITIEAAPGIIANITADAGGVPIDINGGSQDAVVLRGLHVDGLGGSIGIACSGIRALYIESCFVTGFNVGINFKARGRLLLRDTRLKENATAVIAASATGPSIISIDHCRMEDNGLVGIEVGSGAEVFMRDSVIANSARFGVNCVAATANNPASIFIENCSITGGAYNCLDLCKDGIGVHVGTGAAAATVWLSNSTITENKTGVEVAANGTAYTFKNNRLQGNGTDVSGTLTEKGMK